VVVLTTPSEAAVGLVALVVGSTLTGSIAFVSIVQAASPKGYCEGEMREREGLSRYDIFHSPWPDTRHLTYSLANKLGKTATPAVATQRSICNIFPNAPVRLDSHPGKL